MESDENDTLGPTDDAVADDTPEAPSEPSPGVKHRDLADWRGTDLIDRDGQELARCRTSTSTSKATSHSSEPSRKAGSVDTSPSFRSAA